jgi:hypothetical protein
MGDSNYRNPNSPGFGCNSYSVPHTIAPFGLISKPTEEVGAEQPTCRRPDSVSNASVQQMSSKGKKEDEAATFL